MASAVYATAQESQGFTNVSSGVGRTTATSPAVFHQNRQKLPRRQLPLRPAFCRTGSKVIPWAQVRGPATN